ncbi:MAG: hypothetical protein SAL70_31590 [Scytonema sp. PMC 1070.18]|nr:hypothetical protein [Scytonema sp. PMC 1070.18]
MLSAILGFNPGASPDGDAERTANVDLRSLTTHGFHTPENF